MNAGNFIGITPALNWQCRQFGQNLPWPQGCESSGLLDPFDGTQMFRRFFVVFRLQFGNDGLKRFSGQDGRPERVFVATFPGGWFLN
jgi:hypothetical protein